MDKERLSQALDTAPRTLVRTGPPILLMPQVAEDQARPLEYFGRLSPETLELASRLRASASSSELISAAVTAREVFELGLDIPKSVHDHSGNWYLSLVSEFCKFVVQQRCGRNEPNHCDYSSPHWQMRNSLEHFQAKAGEALSRGRIWEFGIVIEAKDGKFRTLTICTPWDSSYKPWHERLTSPEIFVGREFELDILCRTVFDKSLNQINLESAINTTDHELWWQQVAEDNIIIRGRHSNVIRQRIGPSLSDRTMALLKTRIPTLELHQAVKDAKRISGYMVTASASDFPGAVDFTLCFDDKNWVQPKQFNRTSKSFPEFKRTSTKDRWIRGGDSIYFTNYELGNTHQHGDYSIFIVLDEARKNVSNIQFSRHVRLNRRTNKTFYYYLNHPTFGDSSSSREVPLSGDTKPLEVTSLQKCRDVFTEALASSQEGLEPADREVIFEAVKIINSKLALFGIEKIK